MLASGSLALASDQEVFASALKRFGVGDSVENSKRPCLCVGGNANGNMGMLRTWNLSGPYGYDCEVPFYDAQGTHYASIFCLAQFGNSIVVLPK